MSKFKYQDLAKAIFCMSILLSVDSVIADPLDYEEQNRIGSQRYRGKVNSVDYSTKIYPVLLDKASKKLSENGKSFIIPRDIDGNITFNDPRF